MHETYRSKNGVSSRGNMKIKEVSANSGKLIRSCLLRELKGRHRSTAPKHTVQACGQLSQHPFRMLLGQEGCPDLHTSDSVNLPYTLL